MSLTRSRDEYIIVGRAMNTGDVMPFILGIALVVLSAIIAGLVGVVATDLASTLRIALLISALSALAGLAIMARVSRQERLDLKASAWRAHLAGIVYRRSDSIRSRR